MQQLRRHREIDLGARRVLMTEIGREDRQEPLHIGALRIPGGEPMDREAVPERMQARGLPGANRAEQPAKKAQPLNCMAEKRRRLRGQCRLAMAASRQTRLLSRRNLNLANGYAVAWSQLQVANQTKLVDGHIPQRASAGSGFRLMLEISQSLLSEGR